MSLRFYYKILFLLLSIVPLESFSQGLQFNPNSVQISGRTSYNVFEYNSPTFTQKLSINFDLSIIDPGDFGYILWINDTESKATYSLTYAKQSEEISFLKFNIDGKQNLVSIELETSELGNRKWHPVTLSFNSDNDSIIFSFGDRVFNIVGKKLNNKIKPEIYFGKRGPQIDVPEMAIRNLSISGSKKLFSFDFNEKLGEDVHDNKGALIGNVENPKWLINESYHWELRYSRDFPKMAVVNFDALNERMIMLDRDSLIFFDFQLNSEVVKKFQNELGVPIRLGASFMDEGNGLLYIYELNDLLTLNTASISALNIESLLWEDRSELLLPRQRHHHIGYLDNKAQTYTIFGGFGNQRFSNEFNKYDIKADKWSVVEFSGDTIYPRYFSGITERAKDELLIYGGMGNISGDQTLGKTNYYDCYSVNLTDYSIQRLWDIEIEGPGLVSARDMILTADSASFFTLCYSEYIPNTHLRLYRFLVENGEYEILGDSIPIISEKIETNANLYSNKLSNELYCTVQEVNTDSSCRISIYSLSDPPVSQETFFLPKGQNKRKSSKWYILAILMTGIIVIGLLSYRKWRLKKRRLKEQKIAVKQNLTHKEIPLKKTKNAIHLFGEFTVIDKNGKDISYLFSPKLKQLFLLILLNSLRDRIGVSSNYIYSVIWPDKDIEKAKNSKGVSLNQIRSILADLDGIELSYEKNNFKLEITEPLYCDFILFEEIFINFLEEESYSEESVNNIISIVSMGPFLKSCELESLDKFKNDFESEMMKIIPTQIKKYFEENNYVQVIQLTKILKNIDSLNELAFQYEILSLVKLDLISLAKKRHNSFIIKYKNENEDDFPHTFRDMCFKTPILNSKDSF